MGTTTIRLDDDLKARVAAAAARAGKTTHAFILDALAETVAQAEHDAALDALAEERWATLLATGETIGWDDATAWLKARSHGEHPTRPAPRRPVD